MFQHVPHLCSRLVVEHIEDITQAWNDVEEAEEKDDDALIKSWLPNPETEIKTEADAKQAIPGQILQDPSTSHGASAVCDFLLKGFTSDYANALARRMAPCSSDTWVVLDHGSSTASFKSRQLLFPCDDVSFAVALAADTRTTKVLTRRENQVSQGVRWGLPIYEHQRNLYA